MTDLKGQGSWKHEEQSVGVLRSCCVVGKMGSVPGGLAEEVTLQVALETRVVSLAGEQEFWCVQESGVQNSGPT